MGRWAAALRQYEVCEQLLREELDIPPSAETKALYQVIKTQRIKPPTGPIPQSSRSLAAAQPSQRPIETLDRYELLAQIGQGGFATVYRARDPDLDRLVALKELSPHLLADTSWVK